MKLFRDAWLRSTPLAPCTCVHSRSYSAQPSYSLPSPVAPKSAPRSPPAPQPKTALSHSHKRQVARRQPPSYSPPEHPPPPSARRPPRPKAVVAQFLPQDTRERNFLLSILRHQLHTVQPSHPEDLWDALVRIIQYPAIRPELPWSHFPSSTRVLPHEEEAYGVDSDARLRIQLSRAELFRAFTILASARPRTRTALSRLLVVVELIAIQSGKELPAAEQRPSGPRGLEVGSLRGGGMGLRERDLRALMLFAGLSYRRPRAEPDTSSAMSLFSQWARTAEDGGRKGPLRPSIATYNALLSVAVKSKSWGLVEGIEDRIAKEGVRGNLRTAGLRLKVEDVRGSHIATLWARFEDIFARLDPSAPVTDQIIVWNTILWPLAYRGFLDEAKAMYLAMRTGTRVDLATLAPRTELSPDHSSSRGILVDPPPPDDATYLCLIQALSHHGDLRGALEVTQVMVSGGQPSNASTAAFTYLFRGFTLHGLSPTSSSPYELDPFSLSGPRTPSNSPSSVHDNRLFTSLRPSSSIPPPDPTQWSLPALHRLFKAFLALPAPPRSAQAPYGGLRSAPSAKVISARLLNYYQ